MTATWSLYTRAAIGLALTFGFGLGTLLFAATTFQWPLGLWWPAVADVHAHVQLFGWVGLLVVGVGFHFLPRLRGASLAPRRGERVAWWLLLCGLLLRAVSQPALAMSVPATAAAMSARVALLCSGALECAGATVALAVLRSCLGDGPPLRSRAGLWPVLPFFVTAFSAYWAALAVNLAGLTTLLHSTAVLPPDWATVIVTQGALYGFVVPIAVGMSERTFPMFFRTRRPLFPVLRGALAVLLAGMPARIAGTLSGSTLPEALGGLAEAGACVAFVVALGVFAPRRPLPRQPVRIFGDPLQLHAISAYCWLLLAAVVLSLHSLWELGITSWDPSMDVEVHAIGAGFVTLLILGVGAQLLPGFANRRLRARALCWLTLALGNAAALLRVAPLLLPSDAFGSAGAAQACAGVAALLAIAIFAYNVPLRPRSAKRA